MSADDSKSFAERLVSVSAMVPPSLPDLPLWLSQQPPGKLPVHWQVLRKLQQDPSCLGLLDVFQASSSATVLERHVSFALNMETEQGGGSENSMIFLYDLLILSG